MVYNPCPPACPSVFDRVIVSYVIRQGTTVMWSLRDTFTDPPPYSFQLQVGTTNVPEADDWIDVGLAVENAFFAVDGEQRVWGKTNTTSYRIVLTTPGGVYYSDSTDARGTLPFRDWRIARELVRKERLRNRLAAEPGYLLKRRNGAPCPVCLDTQTKEIRDPDCLRCFGTGFECGYFSPMPCIWADLAPRGYRDQLDGGQARGTIDDIVVSARMLMVPVMAEDDVWVNQKTDDRYFVHEIEHTVEIRGVGLVGSVKLRPAPFTHVIYSYEIPDEVTLSQDC